jgi:HSP20 family protein
MTVVRRPSPFGDFLSLRQAMDRLFEESFVSPRTWTGSGESQLVPMDCYATADELVIEAQLPGVKPDEVEITVEGNVLTIAGDTKSERKVEEGSTVFQEIRRGRYSRSLTLPNGLEPDRATAEFEDGMLTLRIPKAEQVKPRQIKINADGQKAAGTNPSSGSGETK